MNSFSIVFSLIYHIRIDLGTTKNIYTELNIELKFCIFFKIKNKCLYLK